MTEPTNPATDAPANVTPITQDAAANRKAARSAPKASRSRAARNAEAAATKAATAKPEPKATKAPAKATKAPAKAKAAAAPKAARVPAAQAPAEKIAAFKKERAAYEVPAGYVLKYPHPSYDLLRKADKSVEGPAWWVVCTAHGTFAEAAKATEGDKTGGKAGRPTWCKGCKAEAAKAAK